jgi:hypothetical protein
MAIARLFFRPPFVGLAEIARVLVRFDHVVKKAT